MSGSPSASLLCMCCYRGFGILMRLREYDWFPFNFHTASVSGHPTFTMAIPSTEESIILKNGGGTIVGQSYNPYSMFRPWKGVACGPSSIVQDWLIVLIFSHHYVASLGLHTGCTHVPPTFPYFPFCAEIYS